MEIKKNPIQMMLKCNMQKNKVCKSIFVVFLVCSILLSTLAGIIYLNVSVKYRTAREMYGEYQIVFGNLSQDKAKKIIEDKDCKRYAFFSEMNYWTESEFSVLILADEKYCDIGAASLIEGSFPENENEILCQREFVYRNGFSDENYLGKTVEINNKNYNISGLIESNLIGNVSDSITNVFVGRIDKDIESYSILIDTGSVSYKGKMNQMIKKYEIKDYYENKQALTQAQISNIGIVEGVNAFLVIMYIGVLVLIMFITLVLVKFYHLNLNTHMKIYDKIGISQKIKNIGFITTISLLLTGISLISFICSSVVLVNVNQKYEMNAKVLPCFICEFLSIILFACVTLLFAYRIARKDSDVSKRKQVHSINTSRLENCSNAYAYLAKVNSNMSPAKHIILCVMVIVSSVVCITTIYFMNLIAELQEVPKNYDYMVELIDEPANKEIQDKLNIDSYEKLRNEKKISIVPSYLTGRSVKVEKDTIRGRYREYICDGNAEQRMELERETNSKINIHMDFVGLEEEYAEIFGISKEKIRQLNDDECILINQVRAVKGTGFDCGFQLNDKFTVNLRIYNDTESEDLIYEEFTIKAVDQVKQLKFDFFDENTFYKPIAIVNMNTYRRLAWKPYPMKIYINPLETSERRIFEILGQNKNYTVKNIKQWNEDVQEMVDTYSTTSTLIALLFVILVIVNTAVMSYINYLQLKNEITLLRVIGVKDRKASYVLLYHMIKMTVICAFSVLILSIGTTFASNIYMRNGIGGLFYVIPWKLIGGVLAVVIASLFSVIAIIGRVITKDNISYSLRQWNK